MADSEKEKPTVRSRVVQALFSRHKPLNNSPRKVPLEPKGKPGKFKIGTFLRGSKNKNKNAVKNDDELSQCYQSATLPLKRQSGFAPLTEPAPRKDVVAKLPVTGQIPTRKLSISAIFSNSNSDCSSIVRNSSGDLVVRRNSYNDLLVNGNSSRAITGKAFLDCSAVTNSKLLSPGTLAKSKSDLDVPNSQQITLGLPKSRREKKKELGIVPLADEEDCSMLSATVHERYVSVMLNNWPPKDSALRIHPDIK